ncbi:hypothetical protein PT974_02100 [Cladobotryum mycophilum]|uniref:AttH domain-containing protein n=1 Tax=Cladobotryum mycophilum TaxID=491253 RepID=A0ABR0SXG0_9HYPO
MKTTFRTQTWQSILLWSATVSATVVTYSDALFNGPTTIETAYSGSSFDGPKLNPGPNKTSYDWWEFDVVSTSSANESVLFAFYLSTAEAFFGGIDNSPVSVVINGVFKNGTQYIHQVTPTGSSLAEVTTTPGKDGSSGNWQSTGFSWTGASDLSKYVISVDSPSAGVSGTVTLESIAPPHLPCGVKTLNTNELLVEHLGWAVSVPDAITTVNLTVGDEKIFFTGAGYHDKNWGDRPWSEALAAEYWGHGRIGPYSLVWFDLTTHDGKEHVSAHVVKDGNVLLASCDTGAVKVRPVGTDTAFPFRQGSSLPTSYTLEFDLGSEGKLQATAFTDTIASDFPFYNRFTGRLSGGIVGQQQYEGVMVIEQYTALS